MRPWFLEHSPGKIDETFKVRYNSLQGWGGEMAAGTQGLTGFPGPPVPYHLPDFAEIHAHWIGMHPTISSSVILFSSCLQSFSASGYFPVSWLFVRWPKYWSFGFSISPSNEYSGLISLVLIGLISLQSKGLSRVSSSTTVWSHQFFSTCVYVCILYIYYNIYIVMQIKVDFFVLT